MPSFNDLELHDLELKPPYMDATLLLDTLSTEDIDWQSYNLFSDENLNSSLKDQIKEENIDIDALSSICPNDLLNSMDEMEHQYKSVNHLQQQESAAHIHLNHVHYHHNAAGHHDHAHQLHHLAHHGGHTGTPAYHHFASSSSSSSSIDSLGYQAHLMDEAGANCNGSEHLFGHMAHNSETSMPGVGLAMAGMYSEQESCFSSTSSPLSSSSSSPSAVSTSPNGIDFGALATGQQSQSVYGYHHAASHKSMSANTLNQKIAGLYQIQNIKTCPPSTIQHQLIKNIHSNASCTNQSPIMMVPSSVAASTSSSSSSNSSSALLVETNSKLASSGQSVSSGSSSSKLSKSNILPLSPPSSSVASDSESNHSSSASSDAASTVNEPIAPQSSSKKANKNSAIKSKGLIKNSLKSSKQSRHHPYPIKSSGSSTKQISPSSIKRSPSPPIIKSSMNSSQSDEDCWPFLCSLSKLPSSGPLMLTEEEKRTLVQEGHQVPCQLPLSKGEEKILKKIRRKIKNKISAQESRRKKKEYVDSLEKRMENYINENVELKKRLEDLELNNKSLLSQLQKMQINLSNGGNAAQSQALVPSPIGNFFSANSTNATGQFGTLFMVLVLFFAVVLGVWSPVLSKDQIANSAATAATAAAAAHTSTRSSTSSAAAVVVATATAAATAATVATIKTEAVSPAPVQPSQSAPSTPVCNEQQMDTNESTFSPSSFAAASGKGSSEATRVLASNEEEVMSYETSPTSNGGVCNPVNTNEQKTTARSKTGTAVELTKVRPFVRKLPSSSSPIPAALVNATNLATGAEMSNSNEESALLPSLAPSSSALPSSSPPVIILNLAGNNTNSISGQSSTSQQANAQSNDNLTTAAESATTPASVNPANMISTATISSSYAAKPQLLASSNLPITLLGSTKSVITLNGAGSNGSNFRVINTSQVASPVSSLSDLALNASGSSTTGTKLPTTRFRLINNPVGSVVVGHPSVIKLNTSA